MKKIKFPKPKARSGAKKPKAPKNILGKPKAPKGVSHELASGRANYLKPASAGGRRKRELI